MLAIWICQREHKAFYLNEAMKVPNLIRKLSYAEVAKIDSKNESSICETVKKEKEICDSFPVTTETVPTKTQLCHSDLFTEQRNRRSDTMVRDQLSRPQFQPNISRDFLAEH